jgi:hypothetical protein
MKMKMEIKTLRCKKSYYINKRFLLKGNLIYEKGKVYNKKDVVKKLDSNILKILEYFYTLEEEKVNIRKLRKEKLKQIYEKE